MIKLRGMLFPLCKIWKEAAGSELELGEALEFCCW